MISSASTRTISTRRQPRPMRAEARPEPAASAEFLADNLVTPVLVAREFPSTLAGSISPTCSKAPADREARGVVAGGVGHFSLSVSGGGGSAAAGGAGPGPRWDRKGGRRSAAPVPRAGCARAILPRGV